MSKNKFDFTIGITFFDRESFLIECLASCSYQSYDKECFEVLVINDNPRKNLNFIIDLFPELNLRVINHAINRGELFSMNEALALAQGEYFSWLADDDKLSPFFICDSLRLLSQFSDIDVLFFSFTNADNYTFDSVQKIQDQSLLLHPLKGSNWIADYISGNYKFVGIYGAFRTRSLQAFGGITEIVPGAHGLYGDTILPILFSYKHNILFCPVPYFFFRIHTDSFSNAFKNVRILISSQSNFLNRIEVRLMDIDNSQRRLILGAIFTRFTSDSWSISCRRFVIRLFRLLSYCYMTLAVGFNVLRIYPREAHRFFSSAFTTLLDLKRQSNKVV